MSMILIINLNEQTVSNVTQALCNTDVAHIHTEQHRAKHSHSAESWETYSMEKPYKSEGGSSSGTEKPQAAVQRSHGIDTLTQPPIHHYYGTR